MPHTTEEERYVVSRVRSFEGEFANSSCGRIRADSGSTGLYIATLRVGYRDEIDLSAIPQPIRHRIIDLESHSGLPDVARKIALIDNAMAHAVTHM